jgi:hypothetical protein
MFLISGCYPVSVMNAKGSSANPLTPEVRNIMGELYLDNIERTAARESARAGRLSVSNRPERRFVADPDARHRCTDCRRPLRRAHIVEGRTYSEEHASPASGNAGELMNVLSGWFGRGA